MLQSHYAKSWPERPRSCWPGTSKRCARSTGEPRTVQSGRRSAVWPGTGNSCEEAQGLSWAIEELLLRSAPQLIEPFDVDVDTAAEILIVASYKPQRIRSGVALAKLAGPIPALSGVASGRRRINHRGHRGHRAPEPVRLGPGSVFDYVELIYEPMRQFDLSNCMI
jgi:hypothetical protein